MYQANIISSKRPSFTLIELLVVIAIIGILSAIGLVSLNGAREKARDTQRLRDLRSLEVALRLFYEDNGRFPGASPVNECYLDSSSGSSREKRSTDPTNEWLPCLTPTYLPRVPVDPINLQTNPAHIYRYRVDVTGEWCAPSAAPQSVLDFYKGRVYIFEINFEGTSINHGNAFDCPNQPGYSSTLQTGYIKTLIPN